MRWIVAIAAVLGTACGAGGDADSALGIIPMRATPRIQIDPELADAAVDAVDVWAAATGGAYAPELVIADCADCDVRVVLVNAIDPAACPDYTAETWACVYRGGGTVAVARAVPESHRRGTIMHEFGHTLGLQHADRGLMNPRRSTDERLTPCVDSATAAAFGVATGLHAQSACL